MATREPGSGDAGSVHSTILQVVQSFPAKRLVAGRGVRRARSRPIMGRKEGRDTNGVTIQPVFLLESFAEEGQFCQAKKKPGFSKNRVAGERSEKTGLIPSPPPPPFLPRC